ncbi:MAG: hypothetical protein P8L18_07455 [Verrucomicrobiota bacterium]|nr:hypothetical protein [Verrucomicrobiota bacterium]
MIEKQTEDCVIPWAVSRCWADSCDTAMVRIGASLFLSPLSGEDS